MNKTKIFLSVAAALCLFVLGAHSDVFGQQDLAGDQSSKKAIGQLKQDGSYDSLAEAFSQTRAADGQNSAVLSRFGQQSELIAGDGAADDNLGNSVAISGNTAVIGAVKAKIGSNTNQGAAYVFVRNSANVWSFQQKLTASDGAATDYFGVSVAIADISTPAHTVIMVGAYANDANGHANQGAVYVFIRSPGGTTWNQQQKLTGSDGVANDTFGISISMTSSFAIVGAHNADTPGRTDVGAAYIFVRSGTAWGEEQKLTTPGGGTDNRHFGFSVAVSGTLAVVGTSISGTSQGGNIYIFERLSGGSTWIYQNGFSGAGKFGYSVALSGETLAIGSPEFVVNSNQQGMVTILTRVNGTWTDQGSHFASDGAAGDAFGTSVAVSGNTLIVGADFDDLGQDINRGSAYVFSRSGTTWSEQQILTANNGGGFQYFGISVAMSGTTAVVGALANVGSNSQQGSAYVFTVAKNAQFDYDGDGKTDASVYRPSQNAWYLLRSTAGFTAYQFGATGDSIVPADYTGDGKTDVAIWRPSTGIWYILRSEDNTVTGGGFGLAGDVAAPGDYDGDGKADLAVYRPGASSTFYVQESTNGFVAFSFGIAEDKPTLGDFDGDGKTDFAVYRPSQGAWYRYNSSNGSFYAAAFGQAGDKVVPADYTGDGKTDIAIWRESTGVWFVLRSEDGSVTGGGFGSPGDIPAPGDYDGDGKTDFAVYRPGAQGVFYTLQSTNGFTAIPWGLAGDIPTPNAYVK